jgi:hypothetical protein
MRAGVGGQRAGFRAGRLLTMYPARTSGNLINNNQIQTSIFNRQYFERQSSVPASVDAH